MSEGGLAVALETVLPGGLAGEVTVGDYTGPFMARDSDDPYQQGNPGWQGKILVQKFDAKGQPGWSLSSTRQTRDTAYRYLLEQSGLAPTT